MSREPCECPRCGRQHLHLGVPPWALSYEDFCELSRLFNQTAGLKISQHYRINEWLKREIAAALEPKPAIAPCDDAEFGMKP